MGLQEKERALLNQQREVMAKAIQAQALLTKQLDTFATRFGRSVDEFSAAIVKNAGGNVMGFNEGVARLEKAVEPLAKIPERIELDGRHVVELHMPAAQTIKELEPTIKNWIVGIVQRGFDHAALDNGELPKAMRN